LSADVAKRVDERRAHPRRKVNFVATVMLGCDAIPCYIVNLSKSGACVRLFKQIKLPRDFTTLTCARFGQIAAKVVWQNGAEVGLKFVPTFGGRGPDSANAGDRT
jgi:hypothetical protein